MGREIREHLLTLLIPYIYILFEFYLQLSVPTIYEVLTQESTI